MKVEYEMPGLGFVRFGWKDPLSVSGVEAPLADYPHYDNPYLQAEFDPQEIRISAGGHELYLKWETGKGQDSDPSGSVTRDL